MSCGVKRKLLFEHLRKNADAIVASGKGILAADESYGTMEKRFHAVGLSSSSESRCAYRSALFSCEKALCDAIGGVIFFEETLTQKDFLTQKMLPQLVQGFGALVGIKVDQGLLPCPGGFEGETITRGLDRLDERLLAYRALGAVFAKWRAVLTIPPSLPSKEAYVQNAKILALYAKTCQEGGIVPIVEPEILMSGSHSMSTCYEVTANMLTHLYEEMAKQDVFLAGTLLKPNMILPGEGSAEASTIAPQEVGEKTLECLRSCVPAEVAGVAFLSGGQSELKATEHLNAINVAAGNDAPWMLTFSYGRALQASALRAWAQEHKSRAEQDNTLKISSEAYQKARGIFAHRAEMNSRAALGKWHSTMEQEMSCA